MSAETLVATFLADLEMENTRAYLARGRAHENLAKADLNRLWAAAYKAFFVDENQAAEVELFDADAELRLRGLKPPTRLVKNEMKIVAARIAKARTPENDKRVVSDIRQRLSAASREKKH